MRVLSAQEFAFAVLIAVCERKSRAKRSTRKQSSIIDDCLECFDDPRLSPAVRKLRPGGFDPAEAEHREMCAQTARLFETVAPIVRVLADDAFILRRPPRA